MNPLWLWKFGPWIVAAACLALAGFAYTLLQHEKTARAKDAATYEKAKTAAAEARNKALLDQAMDFNAKIAKMEETHEATQRLLEQFRTAADAGANALRNLGTTNSRLRDQLATSELASRAALEVAGTVGQCQATAEAATVRGRLLQSCIGETESLGADALAVARDADAQFAAVSECAANWKVIK